MTLNTTHILLLILSGLVITVLILCQLRQVYRSTKSKSIMSKYPLTVAAILYRGLMEGSNETIFDKRKKEYIQEEKERAFVSSVLKEYPHAIGYLIGNHLSNTETLSKDEVHTIYSNRDSIESIESSEADKAFYEQRYKRLGWEYPNGVEVYKKLYENENHIVPFKDYDEEELKELEYKYEETLLFEVWEDEQNEFIEFCKGVNFDGFNCYYHDIDFTIPGYAGMNSDIYYRVCQHYKYLYCNDDELDQTRCSDIIENRDTLEKYKNNTIDYSKVSFNKTLALIDAIEEKYGGVFVIFGDCGVSKDGGIEFDYKKLQQVLDDKNIRYYEMKGKLPTYLPTHHVVVIELCTSNKHLISLCKSIIESYRRMPCFTYISLFKELDNDEGMKEERISLLKGGKHA